MSATGISTKDDAAIRDLIEKWAKAVQNKNFDGILANHSPDILMFDVPPPIQSKGIDAYKETWDLFFGWYRNDPAFEIQEMNITAGNNFAFVTALMRLPVTLKEGEERKRD